MDIKKDAIRGYSSDSRKKLTDLMVQRAKPQEKAYKLFDRSGSGLFLFVTPKGSKIWRLKYSYAGKSKLFVIGAYPIVSLQEAREATLEVRKLLTKGIDPGSEKKARKAASAVEKLSFSGLALEWHRKFSTGWTEKHRIKVRDRLDKQLFPWLGDRPISEKTAPELLAVIRRIENRGALELAHRCLQHCSAVFRYAVATGKAERDVAQDLRGSIPPARVRHYASLTTPAAVGELLRAIDGYQGTFTTACALKLAPLVFVRPGELRQAEWLEIDFEESEWRVPAIKMKMRDPHVVPLSRQAIAILTELKPLTGNGRFVFPSERTNSRPMSENTINAALRRLGFSKREMTGHGFRSMASTLLNELGYKPDVIERQLAHAERNSVRAAYNFAEYIPERRVMMQAWADYLDGLKAGGKVIAFKAGNRSD